MWHSWNRCFSSAHLIDSCHQLWTSTTLIELLLSLPFQCLSFQKLQINSFLYIWLMDKDIFKHFCVKRLIYSTFNIPQVRNIQQANLFKILNFLGKWKLHPTSTIFLQEAILFKVTVIAGLFAYNICEIHS